MKFPTVGAELRRGCIMVELSMRLPRDGRMSVRGRRKGALPCASRRCPRCALRVIRGRFSGTGETRATKLPKPSAAVFAQLCLATNCRARFSASGGRLALSVGFPLRGERGGCAPRIAPAFGGSSLRSSGDMCRQRARGRGGLSGTTGIAETDRTQRGGRRKVENGLANDNKRDELTDDKRGRAHAEDFLAYNTRRRKEEE